MRNAALSIGLLCCVVFAGECACLEPASAADAATHLNSAATKFAVGFAVGFGKRDITPPPGLAMWGYGDRGDAPAVALSTRCMPRRS